MKLKSLHLCNFRNYTKCSIDLSPGLTVFTGINGQGKTNLLEAIYLISTGRSFRTNHLDELIKEGENYFYLEAEAENAKTTDFLKIYYSKKEKKLQENGKTHASFTSLLGILPAVLSAPEDIELIGGAPLFRRRFLNFHLSQMDPLYIQHLGRYWRAMKQRNVLLKNRAIKGFKPWEEEMVQSAEYLTKKRASLLENIQKPTEHFYSLIAEKEESLQISYKPSALSIELLEKYREKELLFGSTLIGPHRDDISIFIEEKEAKRFASEGQKQTFLLALKLAEWKELSNRFEEPVLFHRDDFGAHLDSTRKERFSSLLKELGQTFLTSPEALPFGENILIQKGSIHQK